MDPITIISGATSIAGLLGSIFDPAVQAQLPEEMRVAFNQLRQRAEEGLSAEEEARLLDEIKGQVTREAAAATARINKDTNGNPDSATRMAALSRLQRDRMNAVGQGVSKVQELDELAKRRATDSLLQGGAFQYQIDSQNAAFDNAQRPWGDLMSSGMQMWAMQDYLKRKKKQREDLELKDRVTNDRFQFNYNDLRNIDPNYG